MDIGKQKLRKWASLLLDTGKRSNLISFKDSKSSTVEVLSPSPDELFVKIQKDATFEVFDPRLYGQLLEEPAEENSGEDLFSENPAPAPVKKPADRKTAFMELYQKKSETARKNEILVWSNGSPAPFTALKNIRRKAKTLLEETGVNVAYMAFGFIHWRESESSSEFFRAPVLLVPIQLDQSSAVSPYVIHTTEDDVIVNPTFAYKMQEEQGIPLPEYDEETYKSLSDYLAAINEMVTRLGWTVTSDCRIGTFSFQKINMYRDLFDNADEILSNDNVRILIGEGGSSDGTAAEEEPEDADIKNPLTELTTVLDADSSQIGAIELAKSGRSFVLQGPPGTGKSHTITNIIAECLSDGKKVLFVSEKLAALNVVYEKLRAAGLGDFCIQLHSQKANKKDFIGDLNRTLLTPKTEVPAEAADEIAVKEQAQKQLDAYAEELHKTRPVIEKTLYQLYEVYASLRNAPKVFWAVPDLQTKGRDFLIETVPLLEQFVDFAPSIGYRYRENAWFGYSKTDTTYQAKAETQKNLGDASKVLRALVPLAEEISKKYGVACSSIEDARFWQEFFAFASKSDAITPALFQKENFRKVTEGLKTLETISSDIKTRRKALDTKFDAGIFELDGAAVNEKLITQFDGFFSRLFNGEYKSIIRKLRSCRKDGAKPSFEEAVAQTEALEVYQRKTHEFKTAETEIRPFLGTAYAGLDTDWAYFGNQLGTLKEVLSKGVSFGNIATYSDFLSERKAFADFASELQNVLSAEAETALSGVSDAFDPKVFDLGKTDGPATLDKLNRCLASASQLDNWCHFRALLERLSTLGILPYVDLAIEKQIEPKDLVSAFKRLFVFQWIDSILASSPVLYSFNRISQDKAIEVFREKDTEQFELNKEIIKAKLSAERPSLDRVPRGSPVAIIRHEGEKKRRLKSIRTLLTEAGDVIQTLKPCFLMSPLSVSTYLTKGSVHFDVVIFDEASQIFPQDAVGAIYRAKQLIVVGDSKQMPPSNFFNASIESDDDMDEETEDVTNFESILDLCSTSMRQLRLLWHYRSRYEQLIAFSNKNFYDNQLITFPSTKTDAKWIGVDYYHCDSLFDRRSHTNRKEAEFIVDLIYKNFEKFPDRSLGVVAFSVAQQELIDDLLTARRQTRPEMEPFFRNTENEPFFIKNLETVQGDERDTIIFSVAYGKDAQGRLLLNFGPLNRAGGERRLNVAVTRAKSNVQLVSAMHYTDIDLKRTNSEGVRLLREYLDYAENGDKALERSISVPSDDQFDSDFEMEVCEFLRSNGFSVDSQVGCSGFRIDLGLRMPESSDYVLAIECDGATYHSSKNARDRDRLRQQILERMGWKFHRVWSTDWFRNRAEEERRLLEAATKAVRNGASYDPLSVRDSADTSANQKIDTENAAA